MAAGRRKGKLPAPSEPEAFVVLATERVKKRVAEAATPREVKDGYKEAVRALRRSGCAAAHYRLSGPTPWPSFCALRLARGYRLVMTFPHPREVVLELLHPHTQRSDPAAVLVELFDLPPVQDLAAWRDDRDPPCCREDGSAPVPETG